METGPERSLEPADAASLRSQLRDLVAILVLPAVWSGRDTARILEALLDVLRSMLRLDLAYVRTPDPIGGSALEVARTQGSDSGTLPPEVAGLVAERAVKRDWGGPVSLAHPTTGQPLHATQTALTIEGASRVVVAASRRSSFPTPFERFVLQSAVTQAEIALHNAGLMTALHQVLQREQAARTEAEVANRSKDELNQQLEQRVIERTRELTAVNEQLRTEILERKRTEEQLRKSEERWRAVFENSAVGIALADLSGRFLATNSAYQTMVGCSEAELRTLSFMDITYEDDRENACKLFTELLEEQHAQHFAIEKRYRRMDGHVIWVNVYVSLIPDTESSAKYLMAIVEDITKRKRSEQRLAVQYAIARVLAESDSLAEATPHVLQAIGQSMEWEWGALWTVDREDRVLRCASIWHAPNVDTAEFDAVSQEVTFPLGHGLPGDAWRSGKPFWIEDVTKGSAFVRATVAASVGLRGAIAFPILLGGEPLGVIEFFSRTARQPDEQQRETFAAIGSQLGQFIERKRAEEALRKTQAELAHVARVLTLGELTASIAHEVNQPLAAVITNGQACLRWLGREVPNLDEARDAAERIIRDGNRASEVILRIRALAKKADPQKSPLEINGVVQDVIGLVQREAVTHGVSLRTDLSSALSPVLGDRVQLQQVILNLTINGIEAMAAVTDRPRELLIQSHTHEADQVLVAVQDSGIGIDSENADRLFNAFFTTKPGGMGMGLSISRSIVEAHGGRLWASRNVGPGTTFQFTLPRHRDSAS